MSVLWKARDSRIKKTTCSTKKKRAPVAEALERDGIETTLRNNGTVLQDGGSMEVESQQRKPTSNEAKPPVKRPPLVESVNALPLETFISRYVSPRIRDFSISVPRQTPTINEQGRYDTYSIEIHSSSSISKSDLESCFVLVKLTSSEMYKRSTTGWSPAKKKNEMKLLDMRYMLLIRSTTPTATPSSEPEPQKHPDKKPRTSETDERELGGFLSFMVTYEDGVEVIYCYEVHLAPELQHRGLGKILLGYYEDIGQNVGLKKAMLTVFKANVSAIRFYERLGYGEDDFSPKPMKLRNGHIREYDYMILSKDIANRETTKYDTYNMDVVR